MKVTLKILASDILNTHYTNSYDCAITRALARAGYPELYDSGTRIVSGIGIKKCSVKASTYKVMTDKVISMYRGAGKIKINVNDKVIPPKNFSVTLDLDI